jgi:hypothetical protein
MADEHMNDTWDASVVQANGINLKRIVDEWAAVSQNKAVANSNLQDQINSQFLRWADDAHSVSNLVANNSAVMANRANNLATTWDNLVIDGEVDTTAQGSMANNLADRMRSVAFEAVQAAMAQTAQTSAAAQGTTGVAQGAMQTGAGVADVAIMAQIAKLAEAVNVIYLKVLGEENTAEKPA